MTHGVSSLGFFVLVMHCTCTAGVKRGYFIAHLAALFLSFVECGGGSLAGGGFGGGLGRLGRRPTGGRRLFASTAHVLRD